MLDQEIITDATESYRAWDKRRERACRHAMGFAIKQETDKEMKAFRVTTAMIAYLDEAVDAAADHIVVSCVTVGYRYSPSTAADLLRLFRELTPDFKVPVVYYREFIEESEAFKDEDDPTVEQALDDMLAVTLEKSVPGAESKLRRFAMRLRREQRERWFSVGRYALTALAGAAIAHITDVGKLIGKLVH